MRTFSLWDGELGVPLAQGGEPSSGVYPGAFVAGGWREGAGFVRNTAGQIQVRMPKVYDARLSKPQGDEKAWLPAVVLLIRVLARYVRDSSAQSRIDSARTRSNQVVEKAGNLIEMLEAAVELRDDYFDNGLYHVKSLQHRKHTPSSPVDWPRTIRLRIPVIEEDQAIYVDTVRRHRARDPGDFVHRLHASIITEILSLFGDTEGVPESAQLDDDTLAHVRESPGRYLDRYVDRTYRDRGQSLLSTIRRYLEASAWVDEEKVPQKPLYCTVSNFELVWEHMLRVALENPLGLEKRSLPRGRWVGGADGRRVLTDPPRIDLARAKRNRTGTGYDYILVFDAKDKRIRQDPFDSHSGDKADHYKQIIYRYLISAQLEAAKETCEQFGNVLVFPVLATMLQHSAPLELLGCHSWEEIEDSAVLEVALDYEQVAQHYVGQIWLPAERLCSGLLQHLIRAEQSNGQTGASTASGKPLRASLAGTG